MGNVMKEVHVMWEVLVERDYFRQDRFIPIPLTYIDDDDVYDWMWHDVVHHIDLTEQEEKEMGISQYVDRIVSFEVEVEYREDKATNATCQTECPNFVKAWVEKEAMKQYNREKGGRPCTSSSSHSILPLEPITRLS